MGDNLLNRAKAFMGLDIDDDDPVSNTKNSQLDITSVLKSRKENVKDRENMNYEIIIYEPKVYEDSLSISASLRSNAPVLVNLRHLDPAEGTRLIDFVCGTAYAIDGHMVKIADTIFLFTPSLIKVVDAEDKSSINEELSGFEDKRDTFFSHR